MVSKATAAMMVVTSVEMFRMAMMMTEKKMAKDLRGVNSDCEEKLGAAVKALSCRYNDAAKKVPDDESRVERNNT